MKNLFLFAGVMLFSQIAHAAITSDIECKDETGAIVYWESTPVIEESGDVNREVLYHGTIDVSIKGIGIKFTPEKSLTSYGSGPVLAAFTSDGQFVLVNAGKLIKDDGDEKVFSGTMEFRVKSKSGLFRRRENTKVSCRMTLKPDLNGDLIRSRRGWLL